MSPSPKALTTQPPVPIPDPLIHKPQPPVLDSTCTRPRPQGPMHPLLSRTIQRTPRPQGPSPQGPSPHPPAPRLPGSFERCASGTQGSTQMEIRAPLSCQCGLVLAPKPSYPIPASSHFFPKLPSTCPSLQPPSPAFIPGGVPCPRPLKLSHLSCLMQGMSLAGCRTSQTAMGSAGPRERPGQCT